ncbi:MAG: hypothetical protein AVDCRST_MAG85-1240, partial [uncultured Solirubrobacteraceae bacterium]
DARIRSGAVRRALRDDHTCRRRLAAVRPRLAARAQPTRALAHSAAGGGRGGAAGRCRAVRGGPRAPVPPWPGRARVPRPGRGAGGGIGRGLVAGRPARPPVRSAVGGLRRGRRVPPARGADRPRGRRPHARGRRRPRPGRPPGRDADRVDHRRRAEQRLLLDDPAQGGADDARGRAGSARLRADVPSARPHRRAHPRGRRPRRPGRTAVRRRRHRGRGVRGDAARVAAQRRAGAAAGSADRRGMRRHPAAGARRGAHHRSLRAASAVAERERVGPGQPHPGADRLLLARRGRAQPPAPGGRLPPAPVPVAGRQPQPAVRRPRDLGRLAAVRHRGRGGGAPATAPRADRAGAVPPGRPDRRVLAQRGQRGHGIPLPNPRGRAPRGRRLCPGGRGAASAADRGRTRFARRYGPRPCPRRTLV